MRETSVNVVFDIATAYRKTAALIAAVKLDVFTIIGSQSLSLDDLVFRTGASIRGLRILCDYLTVMGLMKKENSRYSLTHISRIFLDEESPLPWVGVLNFSRRLKCSIYFSATRPHMFGRAVRAD